MSDLLTYVKFVTTILEQPVRKEQVTEFTRPLGKVIHELTSKIIRAKQKLIR